MIRINEIKLEKMGITNPQHRYAILSDSAIRARLFKTNVVVSLHLLKFQTLISKLRRYFLLKKCEKLLHAKASLIFSTKNIDVFGHKVVKFVKHLKSCPLNELVNLRMI